MTIEEETVEEATIEEATIEEATIEKATIEEEKIEQVKAGAVTERVTIEEQRIEEVIIEALTMNIGPGRAHGVVPDEARTMMRMTKTVTAMPILEPMVPETRPSLPPRAAGRAKQEKVARVVRAGTLLVSNHCMVPAGGVRIMLTLLPAKPAKPVGTGGTPTACWQALS